MKVSREEVRARREQIVDEAARLFRQHGFDGISIPELMKRVGLTHGGFYRYFAAKEELMAAACTRAVARMLEHWAKVAKSGANDPLAALTAYYLSPRHRDRPGEGCLMAALGAEVARQPKPVRRAVTRSLDEVLSFLAALSRQRSAKARRNHAIRLFASLVGALVVARAVNDRKVSAAFLRRVREGQGG